MLKFCEDNKHDWKFMRKGGKVQFCTKCPRWRLIDVEPIEAQN